MALKKDSAFANFLVQLGNASSLALAVFLYAVFFNDYRLPGMFGLSPTTLLGLLYMSYVLLSMLQKALEPTDAKSHKKQRDADFMFSIMPLVVIAIAYYRWSEGDLILREYDWNSIVWGGFATVADVFMFPFIGIIKRL